MPAGCACRTYAALAPEVLATAKAQRWDPAEVLRVLLVEEVAGRDRSALATRRAGAAFPTGKTFDAWQQAGLLDPRRPPRRRCGPWNGCTAGRTSVVCGPPGTGKTFLLEALGPDCVEAGRQVAWFTLEALGVLVRRHRADDTVTKAISRILVRSLPEERAAELAARTLAFPDAQSVEDLTALLTSAGER